MSILKVINMVIMECEENNKQVNDIDIVDGLLLVNLENGVNFSLPYRFMTTEEIRYKVIAVCKWSE